MANPFIDPFTGQPIHRLTKEQFYNGPGHGFKDFGGAGPLLHFANANGYPPAAYTPLFEGL